MKLLQKYTILLVLILIFSCSTKTTIHGTYKHLGKVGGSETIEIKNDSTFYFKSTIPFLESESKGKWSIVNNKIHFKSFAEYNNDYVIVQEIEGNHSNSSIIFIDENNNNVPSVVLILNNNFYEADFNGEIKNIKINKGDLMKIKTVILGKDFDYTVKNDFNSYEIVLKIYSKKYNLIFIDELTTVNKLLELRNQKFKKM